MSCWNNRALFLALNLLCHFSVKINAQLEVGFYQKTCFLAESIVKDEVRQALLKDKGLAAALLRMHFHDCFVRGCDGSVLIDSTPSNKAEKDSPANNPSLRGFQVIDNAKTRIESLCKEVVSCADIVAFAARDSVAMSGGLGYPVPAGRRDGRISLANEASTNLPSPLSNATQLTQIFKNKGLTQAQMVTLSGAHTIGRAHCTSFSKRLYNFSTTIVQDPSLDQTYASMLKSQCPKGSTDPSLVQPLDPPSPTAMDVSYYRGILSNRGLLTSDQTLLTCGVTVNHVLQNARNPINWLNDFANAMVKMGEIGVLTGNAGEVRGNCRVIN